jgi:hypothetical protein
MTLIQTAPSPIPTRSRPVRIPARDDDRPVSRRPRQRRPGGAPPRYRGTGVLVSRAPHRRRPITPAATVGLAMLAALITVWLGMVAQLGGMVDQKQSSGRVPDRLAVVRVDAGESLQHLAARVAPGAPVAKVAQRIRELNDLNSPALAAGQTLIAPIG